VNYSAHKISACALSQFPSPFSNFKCCSI